MGGIGCCLCGRPETAYDIFFTCSLSRLLYGVVSNLLLAGEICLESKKVDFRILPKKIGRLKDPLTQQFLKIGRKNIKVVPIHETSSLILFFAGELPMEVWNHRLESCEATSPLTARSVFFFLRLKRALLIRSRE